ncbi:MAG: outer membrane protein assembly factor BamD [Deltaproteobacteria bacterium]|nr:outer membrane protein assembly factor BamD [Deltaproteobacteria bacterium]
MNSLVRFLSVFFILAFISGCPSWWASEVKEKNPTPEQLFSEGQQKIKEKSYQDGVNILERLKSGFPEFKKMPQVYMAIADAFYDQNSYDKAIARYLQFLELYPGDKEASRAKYQIGMAYFKQIKGTDLDNTVVKQAIKAFKVVSESADPGEWGKKAEEKTRECEKKLGEKELYKARSYIGLGNYKAARLAAQRVLDQYSKLGLDDEAKSLLDGIKNK